MMCMQGGGVSEKSYGKGWQIERAEPAIMARRVEHSCVGGCCVVWSCVSWAAYLNFPVPDMRGCALELVALAVTPVFGSYTCHIGLAQAWPTVCLAVTPVAPTPQERSAPGAGPLTVRKPACFNS